MNEVSTLPARHKLDVDAYFRMAEIGVFAENARVELIDGDILDMAPIEQVHEGKVNRLNRVLVLGCGDAAIVSVQNSVRLDRFTAPEPDLVLLRPRADFYETGERAGPEDVLLVIEVGDSSIAFDRGVKMGIYARSCVPEYWAVDVKRRVLIVYRQPDGEGYATMTTCGPGERVSPVMLPGVTLEMVQLFAAC